MRRLRAVSITIACVTGPYAAVICKLTQLQNSIRHESRLLAGKYAYERQDADDMEDMLLVRRYSCA